MSDDLERWLRDGVRPTEFPPAPPGLRARLVELEQRPIGTRRRGPWKHSLILVPVTAVAILAVATLIGGGQKPSVSGPTSGSSAHDVGSPSPTIPSSPLPTGGIGESRAIELASVNSIGWTLIAASAGRYGDLKPPGSGPGDDIPPDRFVWAVKFASEATICNPLGVCMSPRPGTVTVYLDYFTGTFLSSAGFSAAGPTPSAPSPPVTFSFDVENRSHVPVIVSVASDTGAVLPGFEPGQRGTISIPLLNPRNGVSIEVEGGECRLLASGNFPTPEPFTLLVEDGPESGTVTISTIADASSTPIPLPSNSLVGCGG